MHWQENSHHYKKHIFHKYKCLGPATEGAWPDL